MTTRGTQAIYMQPGATTLLKRLTNRQLKNKHKYSDRPVSRVTSYPLPPLPHSKNTFSDHDVSSFCFLLKHSISPSTTLADTALPPPARPPRMSVTVTVAPVACLLLATIQPSRGTNDDLQPVKLLQQARK
jgi:hypothetical protein